VPTFPEIVLLIGRVLFACLFLHSARGHYRNSKTMVEYARGAGMPLASFAGWQAALWLVAGSLSILLGVLPDVGSLMIALFVLPAALFLHRFWVEEDPQKRQQEEQSFARNVTLLGASLCLFAFFATAGHGLDLTITEPLFDLR
jgi:uncharacterized membrane protein YphA (DoxX/SURF4 family)